MRHRQAPTWVPVTQDDLRKLDLSDDVGSGGTGLVDGDYGDIVVSGSGTVLSLDAALLASLQPWDADLSAIALLATTAYGRSLLTLANRAALQADAARTGAMLLSIVDLPLADPTEPLLRWRMLNALTFSGGSADADIAATSTSALRLRKNGSANGTISFTGVTGTISFTSSAYGAGDLFEIYPPTTIDATLDRVSITLGVS